MDSMVKGADGLLATSGPQPAQPPATPPTVWAAPTLPGSQPPNLPTTLPGTNHAGSPSGSLGASSCATAGSSRGEDEADLVGVDVSAWKLDFSDLAFIRPLGEGSFGRVYLARYYDTLVAAKICIPCGEHESEEQVAAKVLTLTSLLASLMHPNVVQFIGVITSPPAIITEFCSRGSLTDVLREARSSPDVARELTWPRRLAMALDAAGGMLHLHTRPHPIIHRDLKSTNLLVEDSWRVKVADPSLAFLMESGVAGSEDSDSGSRAMNPRWLAPEVMEGEPHGPAADVFSFGVVLWEILTFEIPWSSSNLGEVVDLVMEGGRLEIPPRESLPGADSEHFQVLDEYVSLLRRCWAQRPLDRPSFDRIAAELRSLHDRTIQKMDALSQRPAASQTPSPPSMLPGTDHAGSPSGSLTESSCSLLDAPVDFSDLEIIRPLGVGNLGRVYLASCFDTQVAVKVLGTYDMRDPEEVAARLLTLSSLLASLMHPNVVQFIGVTTSPPAIITEFCSRGSLTDVLQKARSSPDVAQKLTWPRRLAMALDAAMGMLYLHTRPHPILHRDLKSLNLLVEDSWCVKVADPNTYFLMASVLAGSDDSDSGSRAMNPRWLAPEVMEGEPHGPAADVFSFGVVLWEILTFELPWASSDLLGSSSSWQITGRVLEGGRLEIPPRESLPGADTAHFQGLDEYVSLLRRCWAQRPLDRPSFDRIAAELRSLHDRTIQEMDALSQRPSASQTPSPPSALPGTDHAGSPSGSLTESSSAVAGSSGAPPSGTAAWQGSSVHRCTAYDFENEHQLPMLSEEHLQAPAEAQEAASAAGLQGHASGGEREAGLVDISAWKLDFSDLKIIKTLGQGSFGRVYLASYFETLVAAKSLISSDERELEAQAAANLLTPSTPIPAALNKEASLLASLRHPNVVQFIGVTTSPPAIITEFCSRGSLVDVLREARSSPNVARELTWPRRLAMALDAAVGMLYLHTRPHPIIHRDLKSPNLLVEDSWRVKVADLNLSRLMESASAGSKSSGAAVENPRWLAPEVMLGKRPGPAADVFSFGVVLWEILTFEFPWGPNSASVSSHWELVGYVLNGGRLEVPPRERIPGADTPHFQGLDGYIALLRRCWAQQPLDRPGFKHIAAELRSLLDRTVQEMGALSLPPAATHPATRVVG